MKRRPLGRHDGNRPKRSTASVTSSPLDDASSWRHDYSSNAHKPPLPPSAKKKSRTPAASEKENMSSSGPFDSRTKTPRTSNRGERPFGTAAARAPAESRNTQEKRRKMATTSHAENHPSQKKQRYEDKKHQQLKSVDRSRQAVGGRKLRESSNSVAHVSTSTASGTAKASKTNAQLAARGKRPSENVAAAYLLTDRASKKKLGRIEEEPFGSATQNHQEHKQYFRNTSRRTSNMHQEVADSSVGGMDVGGMDFDSDEQSLNISSSSSPSSSSPPRQHQVQEPPVGSDKDWTLRPPYKPRQHASVVDTERKSETDRYNALQRALLHGSTQKPQSSPRANTESRKVTRGHGRPLVTKGMIRRAREADFDNSEAIAAMLASRPSRAHNDQEHQSPSIVGSTLQVYQTPSADESELSMCTIHETQYRGDGLCGRKVYDRGDGQAEKPTVKEGPTSGNKSGRSNGVAMETGLPSSGKRRSHDHYPRTLGPESYKQASPRNGASFHERQAVGGDLSGVGNRLGQETDAASIDNGDNWSSHPPLPPGWAIKISKSKNKIYYIHPDFGKTWYCPVVLPTANGRTTAQWGDGPRRDSLSGPSDVALRNHQQIESAERSCANQGGPVIVQDAISPEPSSHHRAETGTCTSSENRYSGLLPHSPGSNYGYDADSEGGKCRYSADEMNGSPGFGTDQSPIEVVEEHISTVRLTRGQERGKISDIDRMGRDNTSDTSVVEQPTSVERLVADHGELSGFSPRAASLFGVVAENCDEILGQSEAPSSQIRDAGESPLGSYDSDVPGGLEAGTGVDSESEEMSTRNDLDQKVANQSEEPPSSSRVHKEEESPLHSYELPDDLGADDCVESEREDQEDDFDIPGDSGNEDIAGSEREETSTDWNQGATNDANSVSSQSNSSSVVIVQQSRRRVRRSYGKVSVAAKSIGSSTSGSHPRATMYRPSRRITNPPHPLCSLQNLDALFEANRFSQKSCKVSSSKSNRRRSRKATDSVKTRLVY